MTNDMITAETQALQVEFPSPALPMRECAQQCLVGLRQLEWTAGCGYKLSSSFLWGAHHFTWFGTLSQSNCSLPTKVIYPYLAVTRMSTYKKDSGTSVTAFLAQLNPILCQP